MDDLRYPIPLFLVLEQYLPEVYKQVVEEKKIDTEDVRLYSETHNILITPSMLIWVKDPIKPQYKDNWFIYDIRFLEFVNLRHNKRIPNKLSFVIGSKLPQGTMKSSSFTSDDIPWVKDEEFCLEMKSVLESIKVEKIESNHEKNTVSL